MATYPQKASESDCICPTLGFFDWLLRPRYGQMVGMDSTQSTHLPTLEDLATADFSTLQSWYEKLEGHPAPGSLKRDILRLHLAWTVQAVKQKVPPRLQRQRLLKSARQSGQSPTLSYSPGTRLIREWQGETHEVTILPSGYLYRGQQYQSLSKVANEITGAHWSGPRFFRMKKQKASL